MRDETLRQAKATLRTFFAGQDSAYLTRVVDACREGRFRWSDNCNCLLGLLECGYSNASVDPSLKKFEDAFYLVGGGIFACREGSYHKYWDYENPGTDRLGRLRTLPLVLAEIRRRQRCAQAEAEREALVDEVVL